MTIIELLKKAADNVGITVRWNDLYGRYERQEYPLIDNDWVEWNPLDNNDDAFELIVAKSLPVDFIVNPYDCKTLEVRVGAYWHSSAGLWYPFSESYPRDDLNAKQAAARKAIVKAAARCVPAT